jgi:hypothetical protein
MVKSSSRDLPEPDDALERVADVERLGAVTLAFCSGLDTCPS